MNHVQQGFNRASSAKTSWEGTQREILDSLGHFRLFGTQKLPMLRPMEEENDDPTSLGVVTFQN